MSINNSPKIKLSIIIPVYNGAKYIKHCLNSIISQKMNNYEVILIDDCSTDLSNQIINSYVRQYERIRLIENNKNCGSYTSRLRGIKEAKGEYITFCDIDDYYINNNALTSIVANTSSSEGEVIQFNYKIKYNHLTFNKHIVKAPLALDEEAFFKCEYPVLVCSSWDNAHLTLCLWNKIYHKSIFKDIHLYEEKQVFWGEDLILNLFSLRRCRSIRFIPDVLYVHNENTGNTKKFSIESMRDLDQIKVSQLEALDESSYNLKMKNEMMWKITVELACWFFLHIQQALEYLDKDEVLSIINESLNYPSFCRIREYLNKDRDDDWLQIHLMRDGNPKHILKKAIEDLAINKKKNRNLSTVVKCLVKKL